MLSTSIKSEPIKSEASASLFRFWIRRPSSRHLAKLHLAARLNKDVVQKESRVNKQLVIFLAVIVVFVGGMAYYHVNTPSPFDGEAFFGPKDMPSPSTTK
jgi:hypothetical protein